MKTFFMKAILLILFFFPMVGFGQCDRQQIVDNYNNIYLGSEVSTLQLGWTGNINTCDSGTISTLSLNNTLDRINYFRDLAGLPSNITFDTILNQKCQESALMMEANGTVDHYPPASWNCYTTDGASAAGLSNLAFGVHSSDAITGMIEEPGSHNYGVGHRRWLLYTRANIFGKGSTDNTNVTWVVDIPSFNAPFNAFVAYPSEGFFPAPLVFGRWSFSVPDGDFSNTTISMTDEQGINIPLTIEPAFSGAGDNTIVWVPDQAYLNLNSSEDEKYTINISNFSIVPVPNVSIPVPNYSYDVIVMTKMNGSNLVHPPNCPNLTVWDEDSCSCINQITSALALSNNDKSLKVFPNPTSNNIKIEFQDVINEAVLIQISNLLGQVIYYEEIWVDRSIDLNLSELPIGTYNLLVSTSKLQFFERFIKNKSR